VWPNRRTPAYNTRCVRTPTLTHTYIRRIMYPDGYHVHNYPSGSRYEGGWKGGRKHGQVLCVYVGACVSIYVYLRKIVARAVQAGQIWCVCVCVQVYFSSSVSVFVAFYLLFVCQCLSLSLSLSLSHYHCHYPCLCLRLCLYLCLCLCH